MHWIVKHISLLNVCLPIIELSRQRYVWVYAGMRCKQPQQHNMTGSCLTIGIFRINILRNKFDALQEISETLTPNDEYKNFVNAHMYGVAEYIPTKLRAKHRVAWEILAVKKKRDDLKVVYLCKRNPTNTKKSTAKAKVKAASQEERIHFWKQHFKNLLGKSTKVTEEPVTKIIG